MSNRILIFYLKKLRSINQFLSPDVHLERFCKNLETKMFFTQYISTYEKVFFRWVILRMGAHNNKFVV